MTSRSWLAAGMVALSAVTPSRTIATAPTGVAAQGTSTLDDQVDLALTVYNSDIALVRDVRNLQLPRGTFDLRFMDIAASVNPAAVHFRSLPGRSRVEVLERPSAYDV